MPVRKLKEFLDDKKVEYSSINHSRAYTARAAAETARVPAEEVAKTVMVKLDDRMAMVVLPAANEVDFDLLKKVSNATKVSLASELEFAHIFPDCELGAMPPFGHLYGLDVYVAAALAEDEKIFFSAGSHTELVGMSYDDFQGVARPKVAKFSKRRRQKRDIREFEPLA
jgi:Ala-tRNA(Pro) deacylase